jgi:hypothetical protein
MTEDFRPIFVGGYMRSGTTLLRTLLDRHPNLAVANEFFLMNRLIPWPKTNHRTHETMLNACSDVIDRQGLNYEALLKRYQVYPPDVKHLLWAAIEEYAAAKGKQQGGEKTPENLIFGLTLLQWFPMARMILIIRDPRAVYSSLIKTTFDKVKTPQNLAALWSIGSRQLKNLKQRYPAQVKIVLYEKLVSDTESTLRDLMPWLGLAFDPVQLDYSIPTPQFNAQNEPHMSLASKPIKIERINAWKNDLSPTEIATIEIISEKQMKYWGYTFETKSFPFLFFWKTRLKGWIHWFFYHPNRRPMFSKIKHVVLKTGINLDIFRR